MRIDRIMGLGAIGAAALLSGCTEMGAGPGTYGPPAYTDQLNADDYEWIDRADSLWEAIGNAPPDYAFSFDGTEPWVWETQDGYRIVVEDAGQGGIRSYYFTPGARTPFLAVEPGASFAFEGGRVAVVYGPDGGALDRDQGAPQLDRAMALYARGADMARAMAPRQWHAVDSGAWIDASFGMFGFREQWGAGRQRHPGWVQYRSGHAADVWRQGQLATERNRRRGMADAFGRWERGGFQGTAPGRYRRPGEQGAAGVARQPGRSWLERRELGQREPERGRPGTTRPSGEVRPVVRPRPPALEPDRLEQADPPIPDTPDVRPAPRPPLGFERPGGMRPRPEWPVGVRPDRGEPVRAVPVRPERPVPPRPEPGVERPVPPPLAEGGPVPRTRPVMRPGRPEGAVRPRPNYGRPPASSTAPAAPPAPAATPAPRVEAPAARPRAEAKPGTSRREQWERRKPVD